MRATIELQRDDGTVVERTIISDLTKTHRQSYLLSPIYFKGIEDLRLYGWTFVPHLDPGTYVEVTLGRGEL